MCTLKDPQRHDDLLNYKLKLLLSLGGAPAVRLCEGRYGIARQEWRLTAALVEKGEMSVTELSERTHIEPGRVSRSLKLLIEKGLVARTAGTASSRRLLVGATQQGQDLYRELLPQLARINRNLIEVLSEQEATALEGYLARLTERAAQIYREGGGVEFKARRHLGAARRQVAGRPGLLDACMASWVRS